MVVIRVFFLMILLSMFGGCKSENNLTDANKENILTDANKENNLTEANEQVNKSKIDSLWDENVSALLQDDLWIEEYKYDAAHVLMLPMHYAFSKNSEDFINKQQPFHNYFSRSFTVIEESTSTSILYNTQYLYFMSRYFNHSYDAGYWSSEHDAALTYVKDYMSGLWNSEPAWSWGHSDFEGMKKRLDWKMSEQSLPYSFYRAIVDDELYMFAIAAELVKLDKKKSVVPDAWLVEVLNYAEFVFVNESESFEEDKWLFQRGVWTDHPNHDYAGHTTLISGLDPAPDPNTTRDSSHAHRYPLVLLSLKQAEEKNTNRALFYSEKLDGLRKLFGEDILNTSSTGLGVPTMNNYMDGNNGLFRYVPSIYGDKLGYGPSELSGTLTVGWYAFLNSPVFKEQVKATTFPLSDEAKKLYTGIPATRNRHYLLSWPEYFDNGFTELYFLLIEEYSE